MTSRRQHIADKRPSDRLTKADRSVSGRGRALGCIGTQEALSRGVGKADVSRGMHLQRERRYVGTSSDGHISRF
jgi:hypothetical protein